MVPLASSVDAVLRRYVAGVVAGWSVCPLVWFPLPHQEGPPSLSTSSSRPPIHPSTHPTHRATVVLGLFAVASMIFLGPWEAASPPLSLLAGPVGVGASDPEAAVLRDGEGWVTSRSPDGKITTAYLKTPGNKGTIGLKGQAVVDSHIADVLSVFLNTTLSTEWVSYLDHVEEIATPKRNKHIIYQFFDMPRPLSDREFLMERTVEANRRTKTVVARYTSVDHPTRPRRKSVIRGETQNTFWKFRSLGNKQTEIEVESTLNPKLPVNGWLIQLMQNAYQRASLISMLDLVKLAQPHPEFVHW